MNQSLIMHHAYGTWCYPIDQDTLRINLKTGKDVDQVIIYPADPYDRRFCVGGVAGKQMKVAAMLRYQKVWTITIRPEYKRLQYYFEIISGEERGILIEEGFYENKKDQDKIEEPFIFPWMNDSDLFKTPKWAADTIWYQIFPDRFCRGDDGPKRCKVEKWESRPDRDWREHYGGDLKGIKSKFGYLQELGITGIYMNPIFLSDTNHRYDTIDYKTIDPDVGMWDEMKDFVCEAHKAGIRVMIDAVFNHCSSESPMWKDVLEKGEKSEYYNWFFVDKWPIDQDLTSTRGGEYASFSFETHMPKLNTNYPAVREYLITIAKSWVKEWGIDGIRFDVGNEVSHAFLKEMRKALKEENPELFLLGEIWHDSFPWLQGDEYDSVMNYPFMYCIHHYFKDQSLNGLDFSYALNECYDRYYEQVNQVVFNLLDSHDTKRLMNCSNGNEDEFFAKLAILFTMQGAVCLYYGTEIEMTGKGAMENRKCMPWDSIDQGDFEDVKKQIVKLIQIRKQYEAARSGQITWLVDDSSRVIHYVKDNVLEVLVNASEHEFYYDGSVKQLYARGCKENVVLPGGTLILEIKEGEKKNGTVFRTDASK